MSNSNLINYTKISPNKNSPRNHAIDTLTIHCMAGNCSVEACGQLFQPVSRQVSSNYGIGSDGRIALYVDETDRSWCSSSRSNDNRAVTIEVANDGGADTGWHISEKAYESLINLVADICKRNGIKELKWRGDKSLIGQVDKQNMTVHRWFANKSCPGDYLYNLHGRIATEVNKRLGCGSAQYNDTLYRVQTGAFKNKDNAVAFSEKIKNAGFDTYLTIVDGLYKVQVGAYKERENAEYMLAKLKHEGFDAFIIGKDTVCAKPNQSSKPSNPYAEPNLNLKIGSKGEYVKWTQWYLTELNWHSVGNIDGIFGTKTDNAVRKFQAKHNLKADGIVGARTRTMLKEVYKR